MRPLSTMTCGILLILAGCSPQIQVHSDFDPDYDLWTYRTFGLGPKVDIEKGKNPLHYNELNDKRIKNAVAHELTARGYVMKEEQPDLVLHYHIIVDDQSVIATEPYGYLYGPFWMRMDTHIYSYREGTLILDLMDSETNHLVWRGWAVSPVDRSYTSAELDKLVKKAVARIFRKFPARSGKVPDSKAIVSK
jgi:hypothetical protein